MKLWYVRLMMCLRFTYSAEGITLRARIASLSCFLVVASLLAAGISYTGSSLRLVSHSGAVYASDFQARKEILYDQRFR